MPKKHIFSILFLLTEKVSVTKTNGIKTKELKCFKYANIPIKYYTIKKKYIKYTENGLTVSLY
jgi:hypothetical protein